MILSVCSLQYCLIEAMAEENLEAKLKHHLKQDKIQLWNPPYTNDNNEPGITQMQVSETYRTMK